MAKVKEAAVETPATNKDKIKSALSLLQKKFGKESVMTLSDINLQCVDTVSTGSLNLDLALGVGGLPLGRMVEIFGPESSGKSTIATQLCANAQKKGLVAAYIDVENAFDPIYAKKLGVNLEELIFSQPSSGEEAFQIVEELLKTKGVQVIILDSIAALRPQCEIDGEIGDHFIGRHAKLMSDGLRKINPLVKDANALCLFINQTRCKIGVMYGCLHGDTQVTFEDGRNIPIREVVENKIEGKVACLLDDKVVYKNIIDWHNNGEIETPEDWITIVTDDIKNTGSISITVTPDHEVMTEKGWKKAKEITIYDKVVSFDTDLHTQYVEVLCVTTGNEAKFTNPEKYDITVEDGHCYFAGASKGAGVLVHNSPETTPGGESMKFYASVRMRISRTTKPMEDSSKIAIGNETKVKVIKNKVAPPFREAQFDIIYGKGIDKAKEILKNALKLGFIEKSGAWFTYEDIFKLQGEETVKEWLNNNPEYFDILEKKIREKVASVATEDMLVASEEETDFDEEDGEDTTVHKDENYMDLK